jgi:hypothetical protein
MSVAQIVEPADKLILADRTDDVLLRRHSWYPGSDNSQWAISSSFEVMYRGVMQESC